MPFTSRRFSQLLVPSAPTWRITTARLAVPSTLETEGWRRDPKMWGLSLGYGASNGTTQKMIAHGWLKSMYPTSERTDTFWILCCYVCRPPEKSDWMVVEWWLNVGFNGHFIGWWLDDLMLMRLEIEEDVSPTKI